MKPKFYFTLGGDLGNHEISEPEGWASIIFNLERDLTYWSLIENFEVPLIFYGIAEGKDGGYNYLAQAKTAGPDTLVTLDIQVSFDGGSTKELCFDGKIDISTAKETIYRAKIEAAIVRNDIWSVFMANKSTPIDIFSTTDIYGNNRYPVNKQELNLPSQKIQQLYKAHLDKTAGFPGLDGIEIDSDGNTYVQFDWNIEELTEITEKYSLPISSNAQLPVNIFTMTYGGNYNFDLTIDVRDNGGVIDDPLTYFDVYIKVNGTTPTAFSKASIPSSFGSKKARYTYNSTLSLNLGDQITIYGVRSSNKKMIIYYQFTQTSPETIQFFNKISISAGTVYIDTSCDSVLLHDAGLSICDRILGRDDTFYSEFFGGDKTSIHYGSNGCGYLNSLTRGLNIRGYSFTEKPFTLSFDDYWNGINPVFNMGLGYETLVQIGRINTFSFVPGGAGYSNNEVVLASGGTGSDAHFLVTAVAGSVVGLSIVNRGYGYTAGDVLTLNAGAFNETVTIIDVNFSSTVIRTENKREFFNDTPSVHLTAINDITNEFDLNIFTKTIEIGFAQWEAESASGIDDPQTSHIYALRYKLFGKDEKQLSKFIAASLPMEEGRRLSKTQSNDWRLDENIFIVALQEQDAQGSSPAFITEQPEVFATGVTGINNPETRYNVRHTPARMLQRWMDFYSGQLQSYPTDQIKYQSGQGNVNMTWAGDGSCDVGTLTENQDQGIFSNYLFLPIIYSFTHPLNWTDYKTIRDNRKKAISISWIDPYGITQVKTAFIKKLSYDINKAKAAFDVWIKVIQGTTWSAVDSADNTKQWDSICFGNGIFVAVGSAGAIMTSPDGITWTLRSSPVITSWQSVCFGNGIFVAVAPTSLNIITSPDGITWTLRTGASSGLWTRVAFGNGIFVAVANISNVVQTSPDGITWTLRSIPLSSGYFSLAFGNGIFVAIGQSSTNNEVITSPDGITWTLRSQPLAINFFALTFGNGKFIAFDNAGIGHVIVSNDGINWVAYTSPTSPIGWTSLTFGNGIFVAVGFSSSDIMTSPDGITWTLISNAIPQANQWASIAFGNSTFAAVSTNGTKRAMYSNS